MSPAAISGCRLVVLLRQLGRVSAGNPTFTPYRWFGNMMAFSSSHPHIPTPVTLCRLMQPGDANIAGNVHGGTILKMIEEAGMIATTRFCNRNKEESEPQVLCVLARVERTDFCLPMFVGEVSHLHGEVTFTSKRSLEIQMSVWAENVMTNTKRLTNKASLWYVPVTDNGTAYTSVPELQFASDALREAGLVRYQKQKEERATVNDFDLHTDFSLPAVQLDRAEHGTVAHAQSSLIHLVGVNDCGIHGPVTGGVTMKMMDEAAGICAARHCHTNVVTASMDATNFHRSIRKGCLMHLKSRPTFTSNKSIEIEVVVDVERVRLVAGETQSEWYRACSAFFTYVSLDKNYKPVSIVQLIRKTPAEEERFKAGENRYQQRKEARNKLYQGDTVTLNSSSKIYVTTRHRIFLTAANQNSFTIKPGGPGKFGFLLVGDERSDYTIHDPRYDLTVFEVTCQELAAEDAVVAEFGLSRIARARKANMPGPGPLLRLGELVKRNSVLNAHDFLPA